MAIQAFLTALRNLLWGKLAEQPDEERRVLVTATADHRMLTMEPSERSTSMNMAYEKLMQHFDDREIRYLTDGEGRKIFADFTGEAGTYRIVAGVDIEAELFQVFGCPSVRIPEGARPAIAETLVRANHRLMVGKFEMDYDAGELYFHASQMLTDDGLEDQVIDRLMGVTMTMLDTYLPAVLSVVYGNELPADAVRCVEAGLRHRGEEESC